MNAESMSNAVWESRNLSACGWIGRSLNDACDAWVEAVKASGSRKCRPLLQGALTIRRSEPASHCRIAMVSRKGLSTNSITLGSLEFRANGRITERVDDYPNPLKMSEPRAIMLAGTIAGGSGPKISEPRAMQPTAPAA